MKKGRHEKIIEIIQKESIATQGEILDKLKSCGYDVTQATVSRDIKSLHIIKILTGDGKYCYAVPAQKHVDVKSELDPLFSSSVISVDYAQNLVVVKTAAGMAQAVCTALDTAGFEEAVGSVAGDDTIFIAAKSNENAISLASKLKVIGV